MLYKYVGEEEVYNYFDQTFVNNIVGLFHKVWLSSTSLHSDNPMIRL